MSARKFVTSIATSAAAPLGRISAVTGDFIAAADLPAGTGTVTSIGVTAPAAGITVTGGPITTSGSITLALANDLAALEALTGIGIIPYRSAADTWSGVTIGSGLSFAGGTLSCTVSPGTGTVTSVGLALPAIFTVTGSPVTGAGTLTGTLATQSANAVFAGPASGVAAAPTFRSLVPADIPVMVGAGASHAPGAVPDPGATAHANHPYFLGDDGAWHALKGESLGTDVTPAPQSTTSTTPVDLLTPDTVTFTLDEAATIEVVAFATVSNSSAGVSCRLDINADGSLTRVGRQTCDTASATYHCAGGMTTTLAAGSHTLKLQYSVSAGTGTFQDRYLAVRRVG